MTRRTAGRPHQRLAALLLALLPLLIAPADSAEEELRVGIYPFGMLASTQSPGAGQGLFVDLLDYVAEQEGWQVTYVPGTLRQCRDRLQENQIDLLLAAAYTRADQETFRFGRETVISTWAQLYVRPESTAQSWLDLAGHPIGIERDVPYNAALRETVRRLGIRCTIVELKDAQKVLEAIEKGWVDAGVVDRFDGHQYEHHFDLKRTPVIFAPIELRFAAPRQPQSALLPALDYHIDLLKRDHRSLYYRLVDRALDRQPTKGLPEFVLYAGAALCLTALILGAISFFLRLQVKRRTQELLQKNRELEQEVEMRRQAEEAFRQSSQVLEKSFGSIREGLLIIAADGKRILRSNQAAQHLLGYTEEELKTCALADLHANPSTMEAFRRLLPAAMGKRGCLDANVELKRRDGSRFPAELVVTPTTAAQTTPDSIWVAVIRDMTARIQASEALQHSEARLRQAQKMESIGTLAGGIAHDFNNMLTPIIAYTEMTMLDMEKDAPHHMHCQQVLEAAHRAKDLVGQILAFSRRGARERRPLRLRTIIKEVLKLLRATIPATIEIRHRIKTEDDIVAADPTEIHQVLMNLCINATHAMDGGGRLQVSLEAHEGPVLGWPAETALDEKAYLRLSVEDTGTGIPPDVLARIFDPFFTTKAPDIGTGMGLAVVHGIIQSSEGAITVDTELGRGTTFHIYLPTCTVLSEGQIEGDADQPRGQGEAILFVDDDEMITRMGQDILGSLGYQVITCGNGQEALELFRANTDLFDIVMTDQIMPGMTGSELAAAILSEFPRQPVVLCTGFSESVSAEDARALGIQAFLRKPFVVSDLARALRDVLAGKAEPATA